MLTRRGRLLRNSLYLALTASLTACGGGGSTSPIPGAPFGAPAPLAGDRGSLEGSARTLGSAASSIDAVLADHPSALFRMTDTNGVLTDSGVNHLTGAYGSGVRTNVDGLTTDASKASQFPGGAYSLANVVSSPRTVILEPTTSLSMEAWLSQTADNTTGANAAIVTYGAQYPGGAPYTFEMTPTNTLKWRVRTTGPSTFYSVIGTTRIIAGRGYHVAGTYDGSALRLYLNGHLDAMLPATGPLYYDPHAPGLAIGGEFGTTSPLFSRPVFNGKLENVAIFSTKLSDAQVLAHYNAGVAPAPAPPAPPNSSAPYQKLVLQDGALSYYRLDDLGATLTDSGPTHVNGTYGTGVHHGAAPVTTDPYGAASFPGGTSSAGLASTLRNAAIEPATAVSLEAWVAVSGQNAANTYVPLVSYGSDKAGAGYTYQLMLNANNVPTFSVRTSQGYRTLGGPFLLPGHAYHLLGTYDGAAMHIYEDGVLQNQQPASAALFYLRGMGPQYGLQIGGTLDGAISPNFTGTLGAVAVYGKALSAATAMAHYNAGNLAISAVETPKSADAFVDSIGVNTHFHYQGGDYDTQWPTLEPLLANSGIRHIREGLAGNSWPTYFDRMRQLTSAGIHGSVVPTDYTVTASDIVADEALGRGFIEDFEGLNEPDIFIHWNWVNLTRSFQQMLWTTIKTNATLAHYPVLAPSLTNPVAAVNLGDLSAYSDAGNIHDYLGTHEPESPGYGSRTQFGNAGGLPFYQTFAAVVSGNKPVWSTEAGYGTGSQTSAQSLSLRADGLYAARTYLYQFLRGIPRTFIYEFTDERQNANNAPFSRNGLLDTNFQPKPAYVALQSLAKYLGDRGASAATAPLSFGIAGDTAGLDHLLLQKADGTYYLVLWLGVPSWDFYHGGDLTVAPQNITVELKSNPRSAAVVRLDDGGTLRAQSGSFSNGNLAASIDDHVTIVSFHL